MADRQLTYWGLSYGTFLGETYANTFDPSHPRRELMTFGPYRYGRPTLTLPEGEV